MPIAVPGIVVSAHAAEITCLQHVAAVHEGVRCADPATHRPLRVLWEAPKQATQKLYPYRRKFVECISADLL